MHINHDLIINYLLETKKSSQTRELTGHTIRDNFQFNAMYYVGQQWWDLDATNRIISTLNKYFAQLIVTHNKFCVDDLRFHDLEITRKS